MGARRQRRGTRACSSLTEGSWSAGQPQVADAARIQRGVLELLSLQRWARSVRIDGDQHAAIGTADREADEQEFDDIGPDQ